MKTESILHKVVSFYSKVPKEAHVFSYLTFSNSKQLKCFPVGMVGGICSNKGYFRFHQVHGVLQVSSSTRCSSGVTNMTKDTVELLRYSMTYDDVLT